MSDVPRPVRVPPHVPLCAADPPLAEAEERGLWTLSFVLACDVPPDRRLWLCIHGGRNMKQAWSGLQTDDPEAEGYVCAETVSGERLTCAGRSEDSGVFSFVVPEDGLKQGDPVTVRLGGNAGTTSPKLTQPGKFFLLMSASPGDETAPPTLCGEPLERIVGACVMDIIGGEIAGIRVFTPSTMSPGEEISLLVRPEDVNRNVACDRPGELIVRLDSRVIPAQRAEIAGTKCFRLDGVIVPGEGMHRLEVEDASRGFKALTNPILCAPDSEYALLWGSMHSHTETSDGTGSLDRYFTEMRDECAIDFGATSDHDRADETPEELWKLSQEAVARYDQPGMFTTFLGYEWAKWRRRGDGDRNVYYLHDRRPIFRSDDDAYPDPPSLFKALKDETVIVIPHHPAHPGNHCDWKDHDPEKERLVEIYSFWGCSERSAEDGNIYIGSPVENPQGVPGVNPLGYVQRGLAMGWRVGFSANADDHSGHGSDRIIRRKADRDFTGGLTAVYAKENTREAIWDALMSRRCYATTGDRIIVDFRLDGHLMGSEIRLSEHPGLASSRRLRVSAHGTGQIESIEIVRNNRDARVVKPDAFDVEFEWTDSEALSEINLPPAEHSSVPFTFYYLRVTQENGQMAWASPIWISE